MERQVPSKTARHVAADLRSALCAAGPDRAYVIHLIHAASVDVRSYSKSGAKADMPALRIWADAVEKVFLGGRTIFLEAFVRQFENDVGDP
jgi:hypothetical protein